MGYTDFARKITTKFKNLGTAIKLWAKQLLDLKKQIATLNDWIGLFDIQRVKSLRMELQIYFVKEELLVVLKNQMIYWKQRGRIKGVKFGDENTIFFHTKATINLRNNHIAILQNDDKVKITDHDGKSAILWNAFKQRLGMTEETTMHFDLRDILHQQLDHALFESLETPFIDQEINDVVKELPNDKSSGPDGFNNEFYKACWGIIGSDIRQLVHDFHAGNINLESINSSYITLIPKVDCPISPNDLYPC